MVEVTGSDAVQAQEALTRSLSDGHHALHGSCVTSSEQRLFVGELVTFGRVCVEILATRAKEREHLLARLPCDLIELDLGWLWYGLEHRFRVRRSAEKDPIESDRVEMWMKGQVRSSTLYHGHGTAMQAVGMVEVEVLSCFVAIEGEHVARKYIQGLAEEVGIKAEEVSQRWRKRKNPLGWP